MNQRKQYVVDKKLQLKYTYSIIGASSMIIGFLIAIFAIYAAYNNGRLQRNNENLNNLILNHTNIIAIQDNIVQAMITYSQNVNDSTQRKAISDVYERHSANMKTLDSNVGVFRDIIQNNENTIFYNYILIAIIACFVIIQGLVLHYLLIRKTNRIAGPIHVMSNHMRNIINGNIPESVRDIRKDDELRDFYSLFSEMVRVLNKRSAKNNEPQP